MRIYLLRRFLAMIPMFFLMTFLFFAVQNWMPGGPVQEQLARIKGDAEGSSAMVLDAEAQEKLKKELEVRYGLDKPVVVRYALWVKNIMTLEFGQSEVTRRPAIETISGAFKVSLTFGIPGFFLTYLVCIPLGVMKALKDGSKFDAASSFLLFLMYAIPSLVTSVIFLLVFCTDRFLPGGAVFPLGGLHSDNFESMSFLQQAADHIWHMFLPVTAYLLSSFTYMTLMQKNSLLDVVRSDYIRTARAKGLSEKVVIFKHALRNAVLPLMVNIGSFLGLIVASSIVIERVFVLPGMGSLFLSSIESRDYNVLMGVTVIQVLIIMLGRLVSDVTYVLVDPRIDFK